MTPAPSPRFLRRSALACGVALVASLPLPWLMGIGNASYLVVLALTLPFWFLFARLHQGADRTIFLQIAVIGLAVRLISHVALCAWTVSDGGPFLGPDSTTYFAGSRAIAARFEAGAGPWLVIASHDRAHYYLFAATIWLAGADLFGLQTLNYCLTAFAGPLFFSAWRTLGLRHAALFGLGVAVSPSLIALSINDLLKDPSVFAATVIGLWALVRLTRDRGRDVVILIVIASVSLMYARMARFYVVAFVEVSVITGALFRRPLWPLFAHQVGAPAVLMVIAIVEVGPALLGWQLTPTQFLAAVRHSVGTPGMNTYEPGLVQNLGARLERLPAAPRSPTPTGPIENRPPQPSRVSGAAAEPRAEPRVVAPGEPPSSSAASLPARAVAYAATGTRKLLGPFPWIGPPAWKPEVIVRNDYLLYPGVLIWYALLPAALGGLALLLYRGVRVWSVPPPLMALTVFTLILLAQYLALNLSFRQREFIVPFLAGLALVWFERRRPHRAWRLLYCAYWVAIVLLAVAHLALRRSFVA